MGLQMLSFMGVILVIEPRRVRLMQGHMQESLQQHEAVMREHLDSQLGTHFAQVRGGGGVSCCSSMVRSCDESTWTCSLKAPTHLAWQAHVLTRSPKGAHPAQGRNSMCQVALAGNAW
eukprot:scaffold264918_cov21-Tisochrysis_lutea.AAC.1